jgi:hypothetical protein
LSPPAATGGIDLRGSASEQTVPLPMLRVAQIVPKFCARGAPKNGATPCAGRNKEFFARGVFYLLDCCTNVVIPAPAGTQVSRLGTEDRPGTVFQPRTTRTKRTNYVGQRGHSRIGGNQASAAVKTTGHGLPATDNWYFHHGGPSAAFGRNQRGKEAGALPCVLSLTVRRILRDSVIAPRRPRGGR